MIRRLAMLMALAAAACAPMGHDQETSSEVAEPQLDQAAFRATIDRMREDFMAAADSGNWESAASILDPEVVTVVPGGEDWAAIKAASELPYPPGTQLDITPIEVRQLGPDWGYELGTNAITWTPEGADEPTTLTDTYLVLFRRSDEGWKLYREVATAGTLPEPPA